MDFQPSPEAAELVGLVRELCEAHVGNDALADLDARFGPGTEHAGTERATARIHEPLWAALLAAGVPQALAPESAGGSALGLVAETLVLRELGRALAPVPLDAAVAASHALAAAGRAGDAARVADGAVLAALPDLPTGVTAGEVLHSVPWAPIAGLLCVPGEGTLDVIPLPSADVEIERGVPVDFSCAGRVRMSTGAGERVPFGDDAAVRLALRRRVHLAAWQWGILDAALTRTARYAAERRQFGRPIGTFQGVSGRLADGLVDVDAVRLATLRAASEVEHAEGVPGPAAHAAVAAAHVWACEAAHRVAHTAVHVHGGTGLDRSEPLHRYFLAAKAGEFRLGGARAQLADLGDVLVASGDPWE